MRELWGKSLKKPKPFQSVNLIIDGFITSNFTLLSTGPSMYIQIYSEKCSVLEL